MTALIPFVIFLCLLPLFFLAILLWAQPRLQREPVTLLIKAFLWGAIAFIPFIILNWLGDLFPSIAAESLLQKSFLGYGASLVLFLILVAIAEEGSKHVAMLKGLEESHHLIDRRLDGIIYGVSAALGFSLVDNAHYLLTSVGQFDWPSFIFFASRTLGFTMMHITASGIFGFLYATALLEDRITRHFNQPLHHFHRHFPKAFKLHIFRTHVLPKRHSTRGHEKGELVAEGLVLAIGLHVIYLLLIRFAFWDQRLTLLLVPLLILILLGMLDLAKRLDQRRFTWLRRLHRFFLRLIAGKHAKIGQD